MIIPVSPREFDLYALSLPRGPNYEPLIFQSAWKIQKGASIGGIFANPNRKAFEFLVLRRRADHRFVPHYDGRSFDAEESALVKLAEALSAAAHPEDIPSGTRVRPALLADVGRQPGETFRLLRGPRHFPALMAIGESYLAMPNPDDNFVPEFQTENFDSRLFELYLLAAFREQGVNVTQDHPSPDFLIERAGQECYVEAVTANPSEGKLKGFPSPTPAPETREERLLGPAAARFAKTLRSKLQRKYEELPHVRGKPFALAIADFHAPSSMVWSREALPSYLYGSQAKVEDGPEGPRAVEVKVEVLLDARIPAGLFRNPTMAHLSGVIFSNAATLGKFNRMGFLAGWRLPGLAMVRQGIIFNRTAGALEAIQFELDVLSPEYEALWPGGEAWCQEMDVYHNPLASNPIDFQLLPGATHWFERDGEVVCSSMWENSILASTTLVTLPR